nr:unnamed protein product [Callosobruchus chinensis]
MIPTERYHNNVFAKIVCLGIFLCLVQIVLVNASSVPHLNGRIIGGTNVSILQFPYQASIRRGGSHICGGSIFHYLHVLSAAHCSTVGSVHMYSVRVGTDIVNDGGTIVSVCSIKRHEKFRLMTMEGDIAIFTLCMALTFNERVLPVALPQPWDNVSPGTEAIVSGWGYVQPEGGPTSRLQAIRIPIISVEACDRLYGEIVASCKVPGHYRIVGGHEASITEYPYQVSIQFFGRHGCGGSILTERFILTAAHCVEGDYPSKVSVRVGSSIRNSGGAVYDVAKIHIHPNFSEVTYDYDVALLRLKNPLVFGPGVEKVALPSKGYAKSLDESSTAVKEAGHHILQGMLNIPVSWDHEINIICITGKAFNGSVQIVGGHDVDIADYPYQVSLQVWGRHVCGGTILDHNFILTAAHCVSGDNGGEVLSVTKIFMHPDFDEETYNFDISIIQLSVPLQFGTGIRKVGLPSEGTMIPDGLAAAATGWGKLFEEGPMAKVLQEVDLPTITKSSCGEYYGSVLTDTMFCAGFDQGGKDTCVGDSGGPLVVSGILVGITSWGGVCAAPKNPGVYTNVPVLMKYINSIISA